MDEFAVAYTSLAERCENDLTRLCVRTIDFQLLVAVTMQLLTAGKLRKLIFTARAYATAVLGVVILSVCPSVCLSHA